MQVAFQACRCRLAWRGGTNGRNGLNQVPVTARDSRAYYGHHLTLVPIGGTRLNAALHAPRGVHYALGHYAGTVSDLTGLEDEAKGRRRTEAVDETEALRVLRETPGVTEDMLGPLTRMVNERRGDEPALEATEQLLAPTTIQYARGDRRAMERAFLFAAHATDSLQDEAHRLSHAHHLRLAERLEQGIATARHAGAARLYVVRDFPIALVGYGYTREYSDTRAQLLPLPYDSRDSDKLPLIAVEARTEGILVELDPQTLWRWCYRNGWSEAPPEKVTDQQARGWLLDSTYTVPEMPAATAIHRATHAFSHILMHALAYHSSYSSNSVAEYLLERQASTLIYVAKYTSFNLGGLGALAEQHLTRWFDTAVADAWSCVHDPICLAERGGCHKCLAVAFGCERFNRGLDRGYLVGGGPQDITEGYLYTAASG